MNFLFLEGFHQKWKDILVIGKTIERDNKKYHIIGMTLSDEARLYIIEPYIESKNTTRKGIYNQRRVLKKQEKIDCCYLHCSTFYLGNEKLQVQGGTGGSLTYSSDDYKTIQLFFDMMSAGWVIPEWLKNEDWNNLQLVTLNISHIEKLPKYSPDIPITIIHKPEPIQHILEKTVTLNVGKTSSFYFMDNYKDKVQCYINNVTLIDVWKHTEEQLSDPKLLERFLPDELQQAKEHSYKALEQNCPKGMCYIGIEYECSKDLNLTFYSKQYLKSCPETHQKSSSFFLMRLKPDKEIGIHNFPLKGCVIQTPVPPNTFKIPAELFLYFEKVETWTETVS